MNTLDVSSLWAASTQKMLEATNWTVRLNGRTILNEIDLNLSRPSCTVVVGDSGSGKSMLLRMLSGVMMNDSGLEMSGSVLYQGLPLDANHAPPMVSLSSDLLLGTVSDALMQRMSRNVGNDQPASRQELETLLQRWGAPDLLLLLDRPVVSLSPLYQRMVAIARDALTQPDVLLIDELTRELDQYERFVLLDFVREIGKDMAVLAVLSDAQEARVLRGRVIHLVDGQIEATGSLMRFLGEDDHSSLMGLEALEVREPETRTSTTFSSAEDLSEQSDPSAGVNLDQVSVADPANPPLRARGWEPPAMDEHLQLGQGPQGFYWVIPGKLAGMPMPGQSAPMGQDLKQLRENCGVTCVVSMSHEPIASEDLRAHGFEGMTLPGASLEMPSFAQLRMMARAIDRVLQQGGVVAVHCMSGNTKTGLLLAACLIQGGATVMQAIQHIQANNVLFRLGKDGLMLLEQLESKLSQV